MKPNEPMPLSTQDHHQQQQQTTYQPYQPPQQTVGAVEGTDAQHGMAQPGTGMGMSAPVMDAGEVRPASSGMRVPRKAL